MGKGECSYLLLVPLECQESSCIPVICWESLSTAPGIPLSIAPLASPCPLERNSMEIKKPPPSAYVFLKPFFHLFMESCEAGEHGLQCLQVPSTPQH